METKPLKLIYIAGPGRCGSTLLARLLGEVNGFVNVGEALKWFFDTKRMGLERPCACGNPVYECPFWSKVAPFTQNSPEQQFATDAIRIRFLPLLMMPFKTPAFQKKWDGLLTSVRQLLINVQNESGDRVIVDSSKNAANAYVASQIPGVEVYIIHLVRDSRGMVSSWIKPKGDLKAFPVYKPIFWWLSYNLSAGWIKPWAKKYLFVRYEDFVASPQEYLAKILDWADESNAQIQFTEGERVNLGMQHMVGSNPDRETVGSVQIKARLWKLPWHIQWVTTIFTFPLLLGYGYIGFWNRNKRKADKGFG